MLSLSVIKPPLCLAAFVLWLLAVPMNGPLITGIGIDDSLRWFLLSHLLTLVVIGKYCSKHLFYRLAPLAIILTLGFSLLLPLAPSFGRLLLVLSGISGAFVALRACKGLHDAVSPVSSAAAGLILANLALFIVFHFPATALPHFMFATLPLLLQLLPSGKGQSILLADTTAKLHHYLPFIMIFHIITGLIYSVIYPAYQQQTALVGVQLPFYIIAVVTATLLFRINREIPLVAGVVLGMGAFIVLQWDHVAATPLSLYIANAAQGFIDLFLLAFLLRFADPLRAFGIGLAALCLGIYGGHILGDILVDSAGSVALFGHLFLNLAVLTLYLLNRRRTSTAISTQTPLNPSPQPPGNMTTDTGSLIIPDHLRLLLSEQEYRVLTLSLDGVTYKQIAADLEISESTVKTYMKRICDKFGVSGKKSLFQHLSQ